MVRLGRSLRPGLGLLLLWSGLRRRLGLSLRLRPRLLRLRVGL